MKRHRYIYKFNYLTQGHTEKIYNSYKFLSKVSSLSLSIKEVNYSYIVYTTIPVFFACFKLNTCTVNKVLYAFEAINFKDHFDRK